MAYKINNTFGTQIVSLADGTLDNYQIIIPDLGSYTGAFQITSLEYSGEFNGEVTYSVSLESGGAITFS